MGKVFRLKGRVQPTQPLDQAVSVNARLARMDDMVLSDHAETELMNAGHKLSRWREARAVDPSLIDQSVQHAEWALEALRALRDRS